MTTSNFKNFATQLAEAPNTLEAKGLVLSRWDKSIVSSEKKVWKSLTSRGGFWFSLGEVLSKILEESGGKRMDSAKLKDVNLHSVAKQRRNEAVQFFQNFDLIENQKLTTKFQSMTRLINGVNAIVKPKVDKPTEPQVQNDGKSADGLDEPQVQEVKAFTQMNAEEIAFEALLQCEVNNIPVKEFMLALKDQLELVDIREAIDGKYADHKYDYDEAVA
tara:strand:+ start:196 stop:849 length:654 start_codon:yes stop_codon:yes gene_type:complete